MVPVLVPQWCPANGAFFAWDLNCILSRRSFHTGPCFPKCWWGLFSCNPSRSGWTRRMLLLDWVRASWPSTRTVTCLHVAAIDWRILAIWSCWVTCCWCVSLSSSRSQTRSSGVDVGRNNLRKSQSSNTWLYCTFHQTHSSQLLDFVWCQIRRMLYKPQDGGCQIKSYSNNVFSVTSRSQVRSKSAIFESLTVGRDTQDIVWMRFQLVLSKHSIAASGTLQRCAVQGLFLFKAASEEDKTAWIDQLIKTWDSAFDIVCSACGWYLPKCAWLNCGVCRQLQSVDSPVAGTVIDPYAALGQSKKHALSKVRVINL